MLLLGFTVSTFAQENTTKDSAKSNTITPMAEIKVCTSVVDRMPVGTDTIFPANVGKVFVRSKITGASSSGTIKHLFMHDGKEAASVDLQLKGSPYITWSNKLIYPSDTGVWEVKVVAASGATLGSTKFIIGPMKKNIIPADTTHSDTTPPDTVPPDTVPHPNPIPPDTPK